MPTATHATSRDTEVQRAVNEAVRQARGFDGWTGYEAAKQHAQRSHPEVFARRHGDITDTIKTRLDL